MTNGPALKAYRRRNGVTAVSLARALGVARQTVHTYERLYEVDATLAARYLAAVRELAKIGDNE